MSAPPPGAADERVTVHSSWRGLASATLSPVLLLVFAGAVLVRGGVGPVGVFLLALGLILGGVALLDYPRRAVFTREGIERVCAVRIQRIPWGDIVALERTPPGARAALRRRPREGSDRERAPVPSCGGLVARGLGRRRYLLCDRIEGQAEFDALQALLRRLEVATALRAGRPSADTPPSDLYRRKRASTGEERR